MADTDGEMQYYRAIEDLFAGLRGVPHLLSPKDFQLLRTWWTDGVPLTAVTAGITEVFARRRDRGDDNPIVSLGYCRHAVRRHAKRLAEMRAGADAGLEGPAEAQEPLRVELHLLRDRLDATARVQTASRPRVAAAIEAAARQVEAALKLPAAAVEEHLFALESTLLQTCLGALDEAERSNLESHARSLAGEGEGEAWRRSLRALRDRELRSLLALPRLELG